jgi:EAL domain-containing protein (putative c-di-GMP-specific phosphodiesterase class I)
VAAPRSEAEDQVADLLRTARRSLHLPIAFLSRFDDTTQHYEVVESDVPGIEDGVAFPRSSSFCQHVLDGALPAVMPDVAAVPAAMELPGGEIGVRAYAMAPVRLSDGALYGTLCVAGFTADADLRPRDGALLDVLASAAAVIIEPGLREREVRAATEGRLAPVVGAGGPTVVLQPIVDLATGARIGAEALSRFPAAWDLPPDTCFEQAHSVGLGDRLELLALERAAEHAARVDGYLAVNLSPGTLLTPEGAEVLAGLPLDRVLLELSEHDPVEDYAALGAALAPLRAAGMRLAIDDVGAGFSSLRHIVATTPDVIKLDRSIVTGLAGDPVRTPLVRSLVEFAHGCGVRVVAEGVETVDDAAALQALGADHGQGWFFGRPGSPEALADVYAVPRPAPRLVIPA